MEKSEVFVERVDNAELLRHLDYHEDRAEIEVPSYALGSMPFETIGEMDDASHW